MVSQIKKSWEAVKRLDRLAHNLAHMCRFIWEWIYAKQIATRDTRGGVGVKHSKVTGKLSNGCTDWHQMWYTSADSSWNGHRLNTMHPTIPQWHWGGRGLGSHKFKCLGKLSNGWTDWHQIWYKSADSSGNGHRLNTIRPSIPQVVLGGHKFKSLGKLSNNWTDWHHIWYSLRIRLGMDILQTNCPSRHKGALGGLSGSNIQKS